MMRARIQYLPVVLLFLLAGLAGCSSVSFDTAMPVSAGSLTEFSADIRGSYHVTDSIFKDKKENVYNAFYYGSALPDQDSVELFSLDIVIQKKVVYYVFTLSRYCKEAKHGSSHDPGPKGNRYFVGDAATPDSVIHDPVPYSTSEKDKLNTYTKNGYRVQEKTLSDTILNLYKKDKLKVYDHSWYANHFISKDKGWEIFRLTRYGKKGLSAGFAIAAPKEKEKLKPYVKKQSAFSTLVHMSDQQFYEFIKQDGFSKKLKLEKYP